MSKELPYFRFTASEWLNDDISLEPYQMKGVFIDVCAYYWFKDCSITQAMLKKRFSNAEAEITALINSGIIKCDYDTDIIDILFLNEQYDLLSESRKKRQDAGSKGGKQRLSNAKAKPKQCSSYKDKDKDKDKIPIAIFWDSYHQITGLKKTDLADAEKYWKKLTKAEQQKAIDNINPYFDSLNDKKYCKKARTYLSDKNFNDEFKVIPKLAEYDEKGRKILRDTEGWGKRIDE